MRLQIAPSKKLWAFFSTLQEYVFDSIRRLEKDFNRKLRKSKGRQKVPDNIKKERYFATNHSIVSPITHSQHVIVLEREKKSKKAQKNNQ